MSESEVPAHDDVLDEVDRLIAALESHSDPAVGEQVRALLERIDTVHRTALTHLMSAIRGMGGDAFLNRLIAEPAIRLLLMSYDLIAVDRRTVTEEAIDAVRGHLHAHGIDVELQEVVGGVVYLRLHGIEESGIAAEAVRRDLEAALADGLIGFQQLELQGRREASGGLVHMGGLRKPQRPVLRGVAAADDVPPGALKAVETDGVPILLANVDGVVYAVRNRCGDSPLPLEFGTLEGYVVRCSWHGCRYDVRSGKRIDSGEERLAVYPVSMDDDEIRVALAVEPFEAARAASSAAATDQRRAASG